MPNFLRTLNRHQELSLMSVVKFCAKTSSKPFNPIVADSIKLFFLRLFFIFAYKLGHFNIN